MPTNCKKIVDAFSAIGWLAWRVNLDKLPFSIRQAGRRARGKDLNMPLRHMRSTTYLLVCICAAGSPTLARQATTQPAEKPADKSTDKPARAEPQKRQIDDNDFVISPMRVQDMRGTNYLYASVETTLAEMAEPIRTTMEAFEQAIRGGDVPVNGPPLFIYHGVTPDPTNKFTLEMGFPVREDAREVGEFKLKTLEPFHCATVIFSGPVTSTALAYQQAFTDLAGAGLQPTGEIRESYLLWEGMESVNNITLIQIGVN